MNIYLTEVGDSGASFTFPSLPETITVSGAAKYQSYDIIGKGTVRFPSGTDVSTVSWSARLFGRSRRRHRFVTDWMAPKSCQSILEKWRDDGTVLRLMVTETNINYDVTIQSFSCDSIGASGDIEYSIDFILRKDVKVYTTNELGIEAAAPPPPVESRPEPQTGGTYTVVSGDNLWKIARSKLGAGTRWKEIYDLNKDTIENSAKRRGKSSSDNGHWIYPGDTFTLPPA